MELIEFSFSEIFRLIILSSFIAFPLAFPYAFLMSSEIFGFSGKFRNSYWVSFSSLYLSTIAFHIILLFFGNCSGGWLQAV